MKFLIAGLGSIGVRHYNNLVKLGIKKIAVFRSRKLAPPQKLIQEPEQVFHDYHQALSWKPTAVIIANPTSLHRIFIKDALIAGCNVYLEKPVSHTIEGVDELLDLEEKKKLKVLVGCQFRFHPNLIAIRRWITNGNLGKIYSVYVDMGEYLPEWHPWEDYRKSYAAKKELGGGVILTQIHDLDYLYWLFGKIKRVYGTGGTITDLKVDVEDTALISLLSYDHLPIQLRMDYWRRPPVRKMSIIGQKGEIVWDGIKGEALLFNKGKTKKRSIVPEAWERNHLFISIMKHFINVINGKEKPLIPLNDGIEVLKIALASKRSLKTGETVNL